jgi:hypothetical protein
MLAPPLTNSNWLQDNHINAGLRIIKRDYDLNGLLDPVYFNNPER